MNDETLVFITAPDRAETLGRAVVARLAGAARQPDALAEHTGRQVRVRASAAREHQLRLVQLEAHPSL